VELLDMEHESLFDKALLTGPGYQDGLVPSSCCTWRLSAGWDETPEPAGIPEDRVRYHLCWGSWHGPHTHDLPLEHIIDLILDVKAQTYSFEAANVRHEHEWQVW
jgi:hypothetical protein